jgi:threonine/homoserine/homoserine lactone efflux protein
MSLCAVFTSALFQYIPAVTPVMKWIGALYILFLAISVFRDKPAKSNAKQYLKPESPVTGIIMQFVNIKVIMYGITALSSFVLPYSQSLTVIVIIVIILSLTGFLGTCCWAIFGSLFQRLFERHRKIINTIMALLLVYCAVMSAL